MGPYTVPALASPPAHSEAIFWTTRGTLCNERRLIQATELFNECEALAVAVGLDSFAEGKPVTRVSFKEYALGDTRNVIFDTPS